MIMPRFARRPNRDSTIDSICTSCFQTIASATRLEELAFDEEKHVCDPYGEFSLLCFNSDLRWHEVRHPHASIERVG